MVLSCFSALHPAGRSRPGSIEGVIKDTSGGVLANASVEISNAVSGYHRETITDAAGDFRFTNLPFNPYHLVATAKGFSSFTQDVDVRSAVPAPVEISLKLGSASENITVEATGADLVETESTPHTDVDRETLRQVAAREPVFLA